MRLLPLHRYDFFRARLPISDVRRHTLPAVRTMCLSVHCGAAEPRSEMNPCRLLYRDDFFRARLPISDVRRHTLPAVRTMCLSVHCGAAEPRSEMNPCRLLYREVCDGGRSHKILQAPPLQEPKILPQRRKTSAADGL